jgi:hypothetical protein
LDWLYLGLKSHPFHDQLMKGQPAGGRVFPEWENISHYTKGRTLARSRQARLHGRDNLRFWRHYLPPLVLNFSHRPPEFEKISLVGHGPGVLVTLAGLFHVSK